MWWQWIAITALLAFVVTLARLILLRRELISMAQAMEEIKPQVTNRQLTVGSQQAPLIRLASDINDLYDDIDMLRVEYKTATDDLRHSMAGISHDLRTPLTAVIGYMKLMERDGLSLAEFWRYHGISKNKAQALGDLVDSLFEMTRLENGGYSFEYQMLDASALLAQELAGIYVQFEKLNKMPEVHLPEEPLPIIGDAVAVGRVFANLLRNVMEHGETPFIITGGKNDGKAVFTFSNAAPDLDSGAVSRLFDRFFTSDQMRSQKNTGLGLTLAKEFVVQMDGEIDAVLEHSRLTITVSWPMSGIALQN